MRLRRQPPVRLGRKLQVTALFVDGLLTHENDPEWAVRAAEHVWTL